MEKKNSHSRHKPRGSSVSLSLVVFLASSQLTRTQAPCCFVRTLIRQFNCNPKFTQMCCANVSSAMLDGFSTRYRITSSPVRMNTKRSFTERSVFYNSLSLTPFGPLGNVEAILLIARSDRVTEI